MNCMCKQKTLLYCRETDCWLWETHQWRNLVHPQLYFLITEDTVEPRHMLSYQITLHFVWKMIFENKRLGMHFVFSGAFKKTKCSKKIFKQQRISGLNYCDINVSIDAATFHIPFHVLCFLFSSSVKLAALRHLGNCQMDTPSVEITVKYMLNSISSILCKMRAVPSLLNRFWSQNRVQYKNCVRNINGQITSFHFV